MAYHRPSVPADRILIQALRFFGHHGVADAEQAVGGWYRADLALERDLAAAGSSDRLEDTVSYAQVARAVARVGTGRRFRLIEALAEAIAATVLGGFGVEAVTVRVTKERPPITDVDVASAAVEITRRRPRGPAPSGPGDLELWS